MEITHRLEHQQQDFSLIEMIGVLTIIAILVALISPQVINQLGKGNVVALAQSIPIYRNGHRKLIPGHRLPSASKCVWSPNS